MTYEQAKQAIETAIKENEAEAINDALNGCADFNDMLKLSLEFFHYLDRISGKAYSTK